MHDQILIIDFGSQVTQLIARRVREMGVYSEVVPYQKAEAAFTRMKPKAVILSGGPDSVTRDGSPRTRAPRDSRERLRRREPDRSWGGRSSRRGGSRVRRNRTVGRCQPP